MAAALSRASRRRLAMIEALALADPRQVAQDRIERRSAEDGAGEWSVIDHLGLRVHDVERSRAFYEKALAPLGYRVLMDFGLAVGLGGADGRPDFWLGKGDAVTSCHVAFAGRDRAAVDAFHAAALAAGGRDNGAPGVRAHYHPDYYGAFVIDPDGNNVEVVCHTRAGS